MGVTASSVPATSNGTLSSIPLMQSLALKWEFSPILATIRFCVPTFVAGASGIWPQPLQLDGSAPPITSPLCRVLRLPSINQHSSRTEATRPKMEALPILTKHYITKARTKGKNVLLNLAPHFRQGSRRHSTSHRQPATNRTITCTHASSQSPTRRARSSHHILLSPRLFTNTRRTFPPEELASEDGRQGKARTRPHR